MKISHDDSLKMLGLFTLAKHHQKLVRQAEKVIAAMIGSRKDFIDAGHIGDAIYSDYATAADFYSALERQGIEIEPPAPH